VGRLTRAINQKINSLVDPIEHEVRKKSLSSNHEPAEKPIPFGMGRSDLVHQFRLIPDYVAKNKKRREVISRPGPGQIGIRLSNNKPLWLHGLDQIDFEYLTA